MKRTERKVFMLVFVIVLITSSFFLLVWSVNQLRSHPGQNLPSSYVDFVKNRKKYMDEYKVVEKLA